MNCRLFLSILCFSCSVAATAVAAVTETSFGPDTETALAVVIPSGREPAALAAHLRTHFSQIPPPVRVILVETDEDNEAVKSFADEDVAVLVFVPPSGTETTVTCGSRGKTSPPWMLQKAAETLVAKKEKWTLDEYRMTLYRLGWTKENPHLAAWLSEDIPAIQIATESANLGTALVEDFARYLDGGMPEASDTHYLVLRFRGDYRIVSETLMVAALIAASAVILFFIFIFGFLFGAKSDQHLRDLTRVLWLPFVYLAVNILALYAGQFFSAAFIQFRFGNREAWALLPAIAFLSKLSMAWFFIATVNALNQLIRFPEDSFIYGYIAGIVCFINVFVFAALDFSYAPFFIYVYAIAFIAYHLRHPAAQLIGIAALASPFIPYILALFGGDTAQTAASLAPLYRGDHLWNLRLALLAMPFQLFISRFLHTLGVFGRRHRFYLPVNPFAAFVVSIAACGALLFMPAWSTQKPLKLKIVQTVDAAGSRIATKSLARLPGLTILTDRAAASMSGLEAKPERIVGLTASSQKFLERQLVTITVKPAVACDSIELNIRGDSGIPVRDASEPFELRSSGEICVFTANANSGKEWTVNFSSSLQANLEATVKLRTGVNPWGLTISDKDIAASYELDVTRTMAIPKPEAP
jgi:hypothetical protein